MKLFIVSPNTNTLFTPQLKDKLHKAGEVIFIKKIQPFKKVTELFSGNEERVLAIDPDFCDWKVPNEIIATIPCLKAICLQTTSFSWIDVDFAKKKGIPVMNLRGFSTIAVCEWATMMTLLLARKIPIVMKDTWKQDINKHRGIELRGKLAGVIGLGRIGTAIAQNMKGLGMNVQYWSKHTTNADFKKASLKELMKTSDVIIPAVARNAETKGLLTNHMLKTMKKTAIFVSIVHDVYNHQLLLDMASSGKIYGYGFEEMNGSSFNYKGNVWSGPDIAWCTDDSMRKNGQMWVESIVSAAKGKYSTQVNS